MLNLAAIRAAERRIDGTLRRTPLERSTQLGARAGVSLWLKCENLQTTGSFKVRGAYNKLRTLGDDVRSRGVVTVSAGNHAQALAWAARATGVPCTVVMPAAAAQSKADASAGYGAEVIRFGTGAEAFVRARQIAEERDLTFVHPFDDVEIGAGAGTVGTELVAQVAERGARLDAVVVPIGGGGLISGVATAVKELDPRVKVFGVEPVGAAVMRRSLDSGHPERLDALHTIADGLAAPMAGELPFNVVTRHVDDVVLVRDEEIAEAMGALLSRTKLLAEPAGAAATAAVLYGKVPVPRGSTVVSILSGGNVDLGRLRELL
jgi:threonine dehydratase